MPFRQLGSLRIYQFESMASPHLVHAIFSRHGGVSPDPWRSLNVGGTVGDDQLRVSENRRRAFLALERDPDSIYDLWQIHSARYVVAEEPRNGKAYRRGDILISDSSDVTLFMRFADCVPIMLHDRCKGAVGMAHAGWLGTVRGTAQAAVRAMVETFGSKPQDIVAGLGPSIGPGHYPVGPDVVAKVEKAYGSRAERYLSRVGEKVHFDLWSANRDQLAEEGIENIELSGLCTACHNEDWYSHRAEGGTTGRFGALIAVC
ncbi:MAG: peptidoglycan editing factor PgeF [Anaerolineales bacterium]|nr:peptidoglycan editing factor PgeF [Anaerolineales bacterium]